MSGLRLAIVVILTFATSGCGIVLQATLGWSDTGKRQSKQLTHEVRVRSNVAGTHVSRRGPDGEVKDLGVAPIVDAVTYEEARTVDSPNTLGLFGGGLATLAVASGALLYARGTETCFSDGACYETKGSSLGFNLLGAALIYLGTQDLVIGLYRLLKGDEDATWSVDRRPYEWSAEAPEHLASSRTLDVPDGDVVDFVLEPKNALKPALAPPPRLPPPPPPIVAVAPPAPERLEWVVAVMDVSDVNAARADLAIEPNTLVGLRDQIRVFIAQDGVRTIDRGSQSAEVLERIQKMKLDSYDACVDEACQIELGKALAASHILRSNVTRFGGRCVLNGELVDLRTETTIRAASARGTCEPEGLLSMSQSMSKLLLTSREGGS